MGRRKYKVEYTYWDTVHGQRVLVKRYTPGPDDCDGEDMHFTVSRFSQGEVEELRDVYDAFMDEEFLRKELEDEDEDD